MKRHIPNMITSCNLLCGALAVYFIVEQQFLVALLLIVLAAVFDFCDGLVARALGVSSPVGKELDSLADDVSFGVAPAMMLFCYLKPLLGWWAVLALLMAAFSALRLAKFNLDERQTSSFIGLATPANTLFWVSLLAMLQKMEISALWLGVVLLVLSFVSCYLLIAEIPFFSLKFHDFSWKNNKIRFIFLIGAVVLFAAAAVVDVVLNAWYGLSVGAAIILWYCLLNAIPSDSKI